MHSGTLLISFSVTLSLFTDGLDVRIAPVFYVFLYSSGQEGNKSWNKRSFLFFSINDHVIYLMTVNSFSKCYLCWLHYEISCFYLRSLGQLCFCKLMEGLLQIILLESILILLYSNCHTIRCNNWLSVLRKWIISMKYHTNK